MKNNNSRGVYISDDSDQYSDGDNEDEAGFSQWKAVVDELGSEEEYEDITEAFLVQMGYGKTEAGPAKPPGEEEEEEDQDITKDLLNQMRNGKSAPRRHEPPAIPIPAENLKSAMKGSNKKDGLPDKERKVTWAEDVYDPIPSHFATNNKKSGKNWQKWIGEGAGGGAGRGRGAKSGKVKGIDKVRGGKDKEKKKGRRRS